LGAQSFKTPNKSKESAGLYVHIPFCASKCGYCDFYSVPHSAELEESYINALTCEFSRFVSENEVNFDTLYLGGGTPSLLSTKSIAKLINTINNSKKCDFKEITIEANPCDFLKFKDYKALGFNRISMGVQTLNDNQLRLLGRRHSAKTAFTALEEAVKYFENVSADFIIGIPNESLDGVISSLESAIKFVKHISLYILTLSNQCAMRGKDLPNDDNTADIYYKASNFLAQNGCHGYEISNFCKQGYESLHNLKYWTRAPYLGIGASAHSFINGFRFENTADINAYIKNAGLKANCVKITQEDALFEEIMLGLRLNSGINIEAIGKDYGINFCDKFKTQLSYLKNALTLNGNILSINSDMRLLQSAIVKEFMV